ncbi:hypothetical protein BV898_14263 [Hypsibius exemplaris]|uniref:Uncharacterized protein n=1 Tax=Hypsibius exemplaris TaxID=2072580 RepID=A0A1W0W8E1_HYPEX|nr:hypothetical protein BV898_14263 [Hypsibius exemplaris]
MLNETVFPLNLTNITAVNSNLSSTICKWPGTSHQWFHINALGLSPPLLTVLCNVLNLIVFRAWQKKEPYVLFHILLAVSSLLYGGLTALIPLGRILQPARPIQWLQEIGFADEDCDDCLQMALRRRRSAVISCNVASIATSAGGAAPPFEGPAVTALVWRSLRPGMAVVVASLISNVPHFVVSCLKMTGSGVLDGDTSFLFLFWFFQHVASPFIYVFLFKAYRKALRRILTKLAGRLKRIWKSSRADAGDRVGMEDPPGPGMAIVGASFILNGLQFFAPIHKIIGSPVNADRTFMFIFFYVQHVISPFIYLLFFRLYRQSLKRIISGAVRASVLRATRRFEITQKSRRVASRGGHG